MKSKLGFVLIISSAFSIGCSTQDDYSSDTRNYPSSGAQQERQEEYLDNSKRIDSVDDYPLTEEMRDGYREF